MLVPDNGDNSKTNSLHTHTLIAYNYIILDKHGNIRAQKRVTGGDNLSETMITDIENDYEKLYNELKSQWNDKAVLTKEDVKAHSNATNCMYCNRKFDSDSKAVSAWKIKHHAWSKKIEIKNSFIIPLTF